MNRRSGQFAIAGTRAGLRRSTLCSMQNVLFHLYDTRFLLKNLQHIFPFSQSTISFAYKKTAIPLHQTDVIKSRQIAEQLATMHFADYFFEEIME